jgi:hypothetical protein
MDSPPVRLNASDIVNLPESESVTSVEPMAHRWFFERDGDIEYLIAPRFSRVPPLRINCPHTDYPLELRLTGYYKAGWHQHFLVSHPGRPGAVVVSHPLVRKGGCWSGYVLTVPPGTPYVEIAKGEEMEACLVDVSFNPAPKMPKVADPARSTGQVWGITDQWSILTPLFLQAYDLTVLENVYRQMAETGFTHYVNQVYCGTAGWSDLARPYADRPLGHRHRCNFREPGYRLMDSVPELQADLERIRRQNLRYIASFRINNEWCADWAKSYFAKPDGYLELASRFSIEHPEFLTMYKSGTVSGGGLDFYFPEVRQYRLDIIREWCDKLSGFDGICIDVYRNPPMVSYPEPLVREFQEKTGIDVRTIEPIEEDTMIPEWLEYRAEFFTRFIRSVREELNRRYHGRVSLSARVANNRKRSMLDAVHLDAWIREGLVDTLIFEHKDPYNPLSEDTRPLIADAHARGIEVIHFFGGHDGAGGADDGPIPVRDHLNRWREWGSDGFGFYEAERVAVDGRWLRGMPEIVRNWHDGKNR